MSHIKATPTHEILTYILHGTAAKIVQCGCVDSNHYIYVHHRIIKSKSRPITMRWNSLQGTLHQYCSPVAYAGYCLLFTGCRTYDWWTRQSNSWFQGHRTELKLKIDADHNMKWRLKTHLFTILLPRQQQPQFTDMSLSNFTHRSATVQLHTRLCVVVQYILILIPSWEPI